MKRSKQLSTADYNELTPLIDTFIKKYSSSIKPDDHEFKNLPDNKQYGYLIGASGNSRYRFSTYRELSLNNIKSFLDKIDSVTEQDKIAAKDPGVKRLRSILEQHQSQIKSQTVPSDDDLGQSNRVSVLANLDGSTWSLYERFEEYIGRKVIKFKNIKKNGSIEVSIIPLSSAYSQLDGTAKCDATNSFIIIETMNLATKSGYTNLMLRIEPNCNDLTMMIGHMTFSHRDHISVTTKTVILEKQSLSEYLAPITIKLGADPIILPESIRKFFLDKKQNRLTSPHERVITSRETLDAWHNQNEPSKRVNLPLIAMHGDYKVLYKDSPYAHEINMSSDLILTKETETGDTVAEFTQQYPDGASEKWQGKVFMNELTRVMSILLDGPLRRFPETGVEYLSNDKQMYLMLSVPPLPPIGDTYVGLVSGVRDRSDGLVSRLITVTKKDSSFIEENKEILINFFNTFAERSWVRPPKAVKIIKFSELGESIVIADGMSTKAKFKEWQETLESTKQP